MQIFPKFLKKIEELPRISRNQFCEDMDAVLDKVSEENTAYVLTEDGKPDLVLCPAAWFDFIYDDDFGCIINSAVRYALRRHTYMPGVVSDFVRRYLHILDNKTLSVIVDDIDRDIQMFGEFDHQDLWESLKVDIQIELQKRNDWMRHE